MCVHRPPLRHDGWRGRLFSAYRKSMRRPTRATAGGAVSWSAAQEDGRSGPVFTAGDGRRGDREGHEARGGASRVAQPFPGRRSARDGAGLAVAVDPPSEATYVHSGAVAAQAPPAWLVGAMRRRSLAATKSIPPL